MRQVTKFLILLWGAAYAASFLLPFMAEPTGDGFTRGLNRVMGFVGWQLGAGLLALAILACRPHLPPGALRKLALVPAALAGLLFAGIAALLLYSWGIRLVNAPDRPAASDMTPSDPAAVTQPVKPVTPEADAAPGGAPETGPDQATD